MECVAFGGSGGGGLGGAFLSSLDLISCNFRSFSNKKGLLLGGGGQNPSVCVWGGGATQGLGVFGPSSIYVKRGPGKMTASA